MNPKISVIVPVYNSEKFIERCVDSLQRQTLKEIEIILVNDGSTDDSLKLCAHLEKKYNNIRLIDQKNGGASKARNTGIKAANGEYVGFLDSDDWAHPQMFEQMYAIASENKVDIVQCSFVCTGNADDQSISCNNKVISKVVDSSYALHQLMCIEKEQSFNYLLWNKIFKRDIFEKFDYPVRIKTINDVPVVSRLFYYSKNIAYTQQEFVYYFDRNDANNKSTMDSLKISESKMIYSHIEAFNDVADFFKFKNKTFYQEAMYLLTVWVCSGIKVKHKSKELKSIIKRVLSNHSVSKNPYIPIKHKACYSLSRILYRRKKVI